MVDDTVLDNGVGRGPLYRVASTERRAVNYLVDISLVNAVAIWLTLKMQLGDVKSTGLTMALIVGYYFVFEVLWQRTIGKLVTGTKVVMVDGGRPSVETILIRSLIRLVPFEPFSFLLVSREERTWWHDRWTQTRVVRK